MIGWWIVISTQTPEERSRHSEDRKSFILAAWEVGLGGLDWLEGLVARGTGRKIRGDGYPNTYLASADVVLPLLVDGPPAHNGPMILGDDYVMPAKWFGSIEMHRDRMAACPDGQQLTIEAWDLS